MNGQNLNEYWYPELDLFDVAPHDDLDFGPEVLDDFEAEQLVPWDETDVVEFFEEKA